MEGFTRRISESGCNVEESRMAALGGRFALLMRVTGNWDALAKLEARLPAVGEELGMSIIPQRTRPTQADKPLIPYTVEVAALDHPGIVNSLAIFLRGCTSTSKRSTPKPTRRPTPARPCLPST